MSDWRLLLLFFACVAFGGLIVAELLGASGGPDRVPVVESRRGDAPLTQSVRPTRSEDLLAATLARPLFSPSRRPPMGAGDTMPPDPGNNRLTGIVIEPDRRVAVFAVSGAKPLILTEGESISGWQIESITASQVSLVSRSGTKILQPTLDPNPPAPRPAGRANAAAAQPVGAPAVPGRPGPPQARTPAEQTPNVPRNLTQSGRASPLANAPAVSQTAPTRGPRMIAPPGQPQ